MPGKPIALAAAAAAALLASGCGSTQPTLDGDYPADFSLLLQVDKPERRAYIVEPDRWLRASRGPGASIDRLAPRTRRLTADQMERVHRLSSSIPEASVKGGRYRIESSGADADIAAFDRYLASLAGWDNGVEADGGQGCHP